MKAFLKKMNVVVLAVVLIGILVLANVAVGEVSMRYDLTENKEHSLSEQTFCISRGHRQEGHADEA